MTTNVGVCEAFWVYIHELITRNPGLIPAQVDVYLVNLRQLIQLGARVPLWSLRSER